MCNQVLFPFPVYFQVSAPPVVVREKRAALGPFEDALSELRWATGGGDIFLKNRRQKTMFSRMSEQKVQEPERADGG